MILKRDYFWNGLIIHKNAFNDISYGPGYYSDKNNKIEIGYILMKIHGKNTLKQFFFKNTKQGKNNKNYFLNEKSHK